MRTLWVIICVAALVTYSWMWYNGESVEPWAVLPWVFIVLLDALEELTELREME